MAEKDCKSDGFVAYIQTVCDLSVMWYTNMRASDVYNSKDDK